MAAQKFCDSNTHYATSPTRKSSARNMHRNTLNVNHVKPERVSADIAAMRAADTMRAVRDAIEILGQSRAAAACGVHRTTVARWLVGEAMPPKAAVLLLRILASRQLPDMGRDWEGWAFDGPRLYSPAGYWYAPGDLLAQPHERRLIKLQRVAIVDLEGKVTRLTAELSRFDIAANDSAISGPEGRAFTDRRGSTS